MARVYRKKTGKMARKSMKSRKSTSIRRAGAFGLYRSTRFSTLRAVARKVGPGRTLSPFPDTKVVKHYYADIITLPAGSAVSLPVKYQFRAHSLYDPDYTGVGHQPMFYDEMASQYAKYCVFKSTIKLTFPPLDTQNRSFHLFLDDQDTTPASYTDLCEQHRGKVMTVLAQRNTPMRLSGWFDGPKYNKTSGPAYIGDADNRTDAGASPGFGRYFTLVSYPTESTVTLAAIKVHVQMVFYATWCDPKQHAGS